MKTTLHPAAFRALLVGLLCACFAALPSLAAQTGELRGSVVDEAGMPIPGVRAILKSPQMIGGEATVVTGDDGEFRFPALEPGSYTVTLSHVSFRGHSEEKIQVGIDATVSKDFVLEAATATAGVAEKDIVKVIARAPVVDTSRASLGTAIRPDFTDRTVTGRSYQDVALFAPGVVNGSDAPGNPAIHGGSAQSNQYLLDGLNITDPTTNTFSTNFNFDAIGEVQVLTGAMDAEYGSTAGGIINVVTKSGGDEFSLDTSVYWRPKELRLLNPGEVNNSTNIEANLSVGGPIIKKRLWFFLSGQYVDSNSQLTPIAGRAPIFPDQPVPNPRSFKALYGLGKLKWQPVSWEKVSLLMQGDPTFINNEQQDFSTHPDAERQRFQGGAKFGLTSDTTLSENLLWRTQVGYSADRLHIFPESGDLETPGHTNNVGGTSTINDTRILDDRRYRVQLQSSLSYFLANALGDHELKGGVEGAFTWNPVINDVPGHQIFQDNGVSNPGSDVSGVGDKFRVESYGEALQKQTAGNMASVYLQDIWKPLKSLTLRPGLRFDSSRAYRDQSEGGAAIYNFNTVSPRVGVAWDPFGDGKTVVRGGYFMYAETGFLSLSNFVSRSQTSTTFAFNEITGKYDKFVQANGAEPNRIKDNLKPPIMHEATIGIARELFDNAALSVDFMYRRKQNQYEDDEVNLQWNAQGTNVVGFNNGQKTFIFSLGTPDEAFTEYMGLDFAFEKRLSDNWSAYMTYTLSQLKGTADSPISGTFDNPRQAKNEYGFLADDTRHNLNITLSYDLPFGVQIGGTASYQSGSPYSKLFFNDFYQGFTDRRAPRGYDPGKDLDSPKDDVELRLPDVFAVNARLAWRLKQLTNQDIWLIADVSNVFNTRPVNNIENRNQTADSPTQFGDPLGIGAPLRATVAVRYMF